jgi:hypothetical protein
MASVDGAGRPGKNIKDRPHGGGIPPFWRFQIRYWQPGKSGANFELLFSAGRALSDRSMLEPDEPALVVHKLSHRYARIHVIALGDKCLSAAAHRDFVSCQLSEAVDRMRTFRRTGYNDGSWPIRIW